MKSMVSTAMSDGFENLMKTISEKHFPQVNAGKEQHDTRCDIKHALTFVSRQIFHMAWYHLQFWIWLHIF